MCNDLFRNSSVPDFTGDLNWEKITALTGAIADSIAILIKGKNGDNYDKYKQFSRNI